MTEEFYTPTSNWFKFEKVGDSIIGTFVESFIKPGSGNFPDQKVYKLINTTINGEKMNEDEEYNVGIKAANMYVVSRLDKAVQGQRMKLVFEKEIPPSVKGNKPAKSISPYLGAMDSNYVKKEEFGSEF